MGRPTKDAERAEILREFLPYLEEIVRRDRDRLIGEVARLRAGLTLIAEEGARHGGAWCAAQARSYRGDLDFNEFPETGKAPA